MPAMGSYLELTQGLTFCDWDELVHFHGRHGLGVVHGHHHCTRWIEIVGLEV